MLTLLRRLWPSDGAVHTKEPARKNNRFRPQVEELETRLVPATSKGDVLILGPTVTGGVNSREATEVTAQGYTPVVVSNAQWSALTAADFATYKAIIIGDPTDDGSTADFNVVIASAPLWRSLVQHGNDIIIGTDPVFHAPSHPGGGTLIQKSVDFVLASPAGTTGLYLCLSGTYSGVAAHTPVPVCDAIFNNGVAGAFTVTGVDCEDTAAHIVASHPALTGLTDAALSHWDCSIHEGFDKFADNFVPLAIALIPGATYTASDGTKGDPYILVRGTAVRQVGVKTLIADTAQSIPWRISGSAMTGYVHVTNPTKQAIVDGTITLTFVSSSPFFEGRISPYGRMLFEPAFSQFSSIQPRASQSRVLGMAAGKGSTASFSYLEGFGSLTFTHVTIPANSTITIFVAVGLGKHTPLSAPGAFINPFRTNPPAFQIINPFGASLAAYQIIVT